MAGKTSNIFPYKHPIFVSKNWKFVARKFFFLALNGEDTFELGSFA